MMGALDKPRVTESLDWPDSQTENRCDEASMNCLALVLGNRPCYVFWEVARLSEGALVSL